MTKSFDLFLSHNSRDKLAVRQLAEALRARGLNVWLDEWELIPGRPWQEALEEIIETTKSAAVLVGRDGIGPWQDTEMRSCLAEFVGRKLPVIPVLLPGAPEVPKLPIFLKGFTWVDMRGGLTEEKTDLIQWGVTGNRPNRSKHPSAPAADSKATEALILARRMLFIALAVWAVAWLLPAGSASLGWVCFVVSVIRGATEFFKSPGLLAGLSLLSPWTNFLIPIGVLALHRGRPTWLRRNLGSLLLISFGINLVWLWNDYIQRESLSIGYYLWAASFFFLGVSALLLRQRGSNSGSVFLEGQAKSGRGKAVTAIAGLVILVLLGLLAFPFLKAKTYQKRAAPDRNPVSRSMSLPAPHPSSSSIDASMAS